MGYVELEIALTLWQKLGVATAALVDLLTTRVLTEEEYVLPINVMFGMMHNVQYAKNVRQQHSFLHPISSKT